MSGGLVDELCTLFKAVEINGVLINEPNVI